MITLNGNNPDLLGLSTDTKPTDAGINTLFLEVDTATFYYFTGEDWVELGQAPSADDLGKGAPKKAEPETETKEDEPEQLEPVEVEEPVVEVKKTTTRKRTTTKTTEEVTGDGKSE